MIAKNNPFNVRYNPKNQWLGQVNHCKGFCVFSSMRYGIRCAMIVIRTYMRRNLFTIKAIISEFAPSTENNTDKYIRFVVESLRGWGHEVNENYIIVPGTKEYFRMLQAMAFMETHTMLDVMELENVFNTYLFNNSNR